MRTAAVALAVTLPMGISVAAADATAPTTSTAPSTSITVPTAAQKAAAAAAAKAAAAKKAAAKKAAARKAAAKRAAHRRAVKRHRAWVKRHRVAIRGHKMVKVAARFKGRPYVYGAAGPRAFDCSGLTSYVARKALHVRLPHNAAAQAHNRHVRHVSRHHRVIGDLVFFHGGGGIHHVGIYAGHGTMWAAPHTGSHVKHQAIYSSNVSYGRIV